MLGVGAATTADDQSSRVVGTVLGAAGLFGLQRSGVPVDDLKKAADVMKTARDTTK